MIIRIIFSITIICALFRVNGFTQNHHNIDSLRSELKKFDAGKRKAETGTTALSDSARANILDGMALEYLNFNLDSAMIFARQGYSISENAGFRKGLAHADLTMGKITLLKGDRTRAMEYFHKSLKLSETIGYERGTGNAYNEIGNVYYDECKFTEGLKNHLLALKIRKEIGDKKDIALEYWQVGLLYSAMGDYPEALKNYFTGLKLYEEIGNKKGIGNIRISIGIMYFDQGIYQEALKNFTTSLTIFTETGDKFATARAYWNIGTVYSALGNYPIALNYTVTGLQIFEKLGIKEAVAKSYYALGSITLAMGNYSESLKNCFRALEFRDATLNSDGVAELYMLIGQVYEKKGQLQEALLYESKGLSLVLGSRNKGLLQKAYANLASVYACLGNYKAAYDHELLYEQIDDSVYSKENTNRMASLQMQYEFDKKVQTDSIQRSNENKINLLKLQKQKAYTGMGVAGFILVMLLLFFVYRNYTNQRKATAEMSVARQRAERSEQFKQQFLANMSHEIRTPMNAVMGMTNLLLDKNPRSDQQAYLEGIKNSSEILLHIINDILDLSKIEAGKMELENIDFSLTDMMDQIKQTLQHKAEEKGLELVFHLDRNVPDVIMGDPFRLNQVLINLAGNAIKFTEKGSVAIDVENSLHEGVVTFSIRDTGIGIPEDKLNSVFESFTQANASDTRRFGGTGLGLSISRQMVELMNGKISVESKEGQGTTFSFEIGCPAGSEERLNNQKTTGQIDGSSLDGLKILLVDDNEYNRIVAGDTLKSKATVIITEAANGKEAVEWLSQQDFDVVLMDVQMPVMNGYEATRHIREKFSAPKNQTPVIALTASVIRSDLDKCFEAGMNDYIPKPFKASQLISVIAKAAGREIRFSEKRISPAEPERGKETGVTDLTYLEKFCGGDKEKMQKYITMFLASAPMLIEKINGALNDRDLQEIASQVHGHKTRFIMMGMQGSKNLADIIERQCREEVKPEEISENVMNLVQQIDKAISELQLT